MNPKQTLEQAFQAYFNARRPSEIPSGQVYKGTENTIAIDTDEVNSQPQTKVLPCVTLEAVGDHGQVGLATRCFHGPVAVRVEASAENTTDTEFAEICEAVYAVFNAVQIVENLEASLDDFGCIHASVVDVGSAVRNQSNWESTLTLDCVYTEADI